MIGELRLTRARIFRSKTSEHRLVGDNIIPLLSGASLGKPRFTKKKKNLAYIIAILFVKVIANILYTLELLLGKLHKDLE